MADAGGMSGAGRIYYTCQCKGPGAAGGDLSIVTTFDKLRMAIVSPSLHFEVAPCSSTVRHL